MDFEPSGDISECSVEGGTDGSSSWLPGWGQQGECGLGAGWWETSPNLMQQLSSSCLLPFPLAVTPSSTCARHTRPSLVHQANRYCTPSKVGRRPWPSAWSPSWLTRAAFLSPYHCPLHTQTRSESLLPNPSRLSYAKML